MKKIQFIYLTAFSKTGGIEKFNKNIIYTLAKQKNSCQSIITSLHDVTGDEAYSIGLQTNFFKGNKLKLLFHCLRTAKETDLLLVGHVNLSPLVVIMKWLNPNIKIIVFTHGVEVWEPLTGLSSVLLRNASRILCVSKFTKRMLKEANVDLDATKTFVFLNAVDPFYQNAAPSKEELQVLSMKFDMGSFKPIILSVGRICKEDAYKGFDQTILALADVKKNGLNPLYLLVGKYEENEYHRLQQLAEKNGVKENIIFLGFVPDKKLVAFYSLSDLFVMPSKGEGFGIVFIEAIRSKMAIIAANTGGTPEALGYGKYGRLVDPDNTQELSAAIKEEYFRKKASKQNDWEEIMSLYSIERFATQLNTHIEEVLHD